ncbi:MAG TPA: cupin domain-containing protein [Steroidobacteraceae bacterium]|nr:cupin domain-containing protein [Steroidobacteraceae bacterium]
MNTRTVSIGAAIAAVSFWAGTLAAAKPEKPPLDSHIWKAKDARVATGDWGHIALYTEDGQPSFGASSVLTAQLELLPGKRLQPPHQHPDEEFQYVIEGTGTWTLNGQDYPLEPGDLMYSKPWDWHGIRNSGDKPLRFFVFKWKAAGMAEPAQRP